MQAVQDMLKPPMEIDIPFVPKYGASLRHVQLADVLPFPFHRPTHQLGVALRVANTRHSNRKLILITICKCAVEELLLWRDVKRSGILFGACTTVALFFFITKMSLPTFVCYLVAIGLVVAMAWTRIGPSVGQCVFSSPRSLWTLVCDHMRKQMCRYATICQLSRFV